MNMTDKYGVAEQICADIKTVCKTYANRNAGSEGEKNASQYFAQRLAACADDVKTETFKVNPNAFSGWITASVTCAMMGIVAYFFSAMVSILLFIVAAIPFLLQFVMYKRTLDPLYKEAESQNVTALKKCSGERKRTVFFVANVDAGFENCVKYRLGGVMMITVIVFDFIGVTYYVALAVARWILTGGLGAGIAQGIMLYPALAGLVFTAPLFLTYFMKGRKTVVDGANNNLSGCFIAVNALETLAGVQLENTDVGVIISGSGAVGLRGAKAWCDAHKDEFDKDSTVFIALSTLRELKSLNVNSTEMSGLVKSDKEISRLILRSADNAGVKCSNHKIPFDATDSSAFTQAGFKSAGIIAINSKLPDYYYTRYDSYDNLSQECIAECFGLTLEILKLYSKEDALNSIAEEGAGEEDVARAEGCTDSETPEIQTATD